MRFTAYGVADYAFNYQAPDTTWTHLAYVGTSQGTLLYANGSLVDSDSATISLPMTSLGVVSGDVLNGAVNEVAALNDALQDGQIMTLYLTATGAQSPPVFDNNVPAVVPSGTLLRHRSFFLEH